MIDYEPHAHPELMEQVNALREAGLGVKVTDRQSSTADPSGDHREPDWLCEIASRSRTVSTGEGTTEHDAFRAAYAAMPDPAV